MIGQLTPEQLDTHRISLFLTCLHDPHTVADIADLLCASPAFPGLPPYSPRNAFRRTSGTPPYPSYTVLGLSRRRAGIAYRLAWKGDMP